MEDETEMGKEGRGKEWSLEAANEKGREREGGSGRERKMGKW
jgi:hypothetical protein